MVGACGLGLMHCVSTPSLLARTGALPFILVETLAFGLTAQVILVAFSLSMLLLCMSTILFLLQSQFVKQVIDTDFSKVGCGNFENLMS